MRTARLPGRMQSIALSSDADPTRVAMEASQIGIWSWEIASNCINWSTNLESIYGL